MPERIQLRRTKGWRKPKDAVVVARPSKWGNPFRPWMAMRKADDGYETGWFAAGERLGSRPIHWGPDAKAAALDDCVEMYRHWLLNEAPANLAHVRLLRGHDLACWCPPDQKCHADVLLEIANAAVPA